MGRALEEARLWGREEVSCTRDFTAVICAGEMLTATIRNNYRQLCKDKLSQFMYLPIDDSGRKKGYCGAIAFKKI